MSSRLLGHGAKRTSPVEWTPRKTVLLRGHETSHGCWHREGVEQETPHSLGVPPVLADSAVGRLALASLL